MDTKYNLKYAEMTGTSYKENTPIIVCDILEESRISQKRIKIQFGDPKTNKTWGDVVSCTVGRSTGTHKVPLAKKNKLSTCGVPLYDNCIIRISHSNKKDGGIIYDANQNK